MTPSDDQPATLGEVARRQRDIAAQIVALVERLDRDRVEFRQTYMQREVYTAMHMADNAVVADLATDIRACRDSMLLEIKRVETRLETFNDEYDRDRREDKKALDAAREAEKSRIAEDARAEKGRRQQFTLAVVTLAITQIITVVLAVLGLVR